MINGMSAAPTHQQLVDLGARWLKRQGFSVIATEIATTGCSERPDVIAFRANCSVVIEAKTSRPDMLADRIKHHRIEPGTGLGLYRLFLTPPQVATPEDLPPRWGLLHTDGKRVVDIVRPRGNIWPGQGTSIREWAAFQHQYSPEAERGVLFSIARRSLKGVPVGLGQPG